MRGSSGAPGLAFLSQNPLGRTHSGRPLLWPEQAARAACRPMANQASPVTGTGCVTPIHNPTLMFRIEGEGP